LSRLNRDGHLPAPPFELLDCLSLAGAVHRASGGRFDPTVQPLWALWTEAAAGGTRPDAQAVETVRHKTGWAKVEVDAAAITLQPGMALTLNGIGQGYVADRVAALLEAEGLSNILIDTGELRALGGKPEGGNWPVRLETGERLSLRQRALATSAPLGTTFDQAGHDGHILDPVTGMPAASAWRSVSVSAPSAAIADALATAVCLMSDPEEIRIMLGHFEGARLEASAQPGIRSPQ
jgi:thiamine biosynthesis lipoprotein